MIIDTHQHFWEYDLLRDNWITDKMARLKRDFLPNELQAIYQDNGVQGCIAIQADQSERETDFLLVLADQFDFIKGVVGWTDLRSDAVEEKLMNRTNRRLLKGFRHILQAETPGFMLDPSFIRGMGVLAKYDFTYDVLIHPHQLNEAISLIDRFPDQHFVLDHMGKPDIASNNLSEWKDNIGIMAQSENVYCKLSGLVTEADWKEKNIEIFYPVLDVVFEQFGPERLMFGSDWPVCLLAKPYSEVLRLVTEYLDQFTTEEQDMVLATNAIHFYNISLK